MLCLRLLARMGKHVAIFATNVANTAGLVWDVTVWSSGNWRKDICCVFKLFIGYIE